MSTEGEHPEVDAGTGPNDGQSEPAGERRIRRQKWLKRGAYGLLATASVVGIEMYRRYPAVAQVADAAARTTRDYAPRPNKDVSGQARDAFGRWTA